MPATAVGADIGTVEGFQDPCVGTEKCFAGAKNSLVGEIGREGLVVVYHRTDLLPGPWLPVAEGILRHFGVVQTCTYGGHLIFRDDLVDQAPSFSLQTSDPVLFGQSLSFNEAIFSDIVFRVISCNSPCTIKESAETNPIAAGIAANTPLTGCPIIPIKDRAIKPATEITTDSNGS